MLLTRESGSLFEEHTASDRLRVGNRRLFENKIKHILLALVVCCCLLFVVFRLSFFFGIVCGLSFVVVCHLSFVVCR